MGKHIGMFIWLCLTVAACGSDVKEPRITSKKEKAAFFHSPVKQVAHKEKNAICHRNLDCEEGEYCHFVEGECVANMRTFEEGGCIRRPEFCIASKAPVCGCDGKQYRNECNAAAAGISVAYKGKCKVQRKKMRLLMAKSHRAAKQHSAEH